MCAPIPLTPTRWPLATHRNTKKLNSLASRRPPQRRVEIQGCVAAAHPADVAGMTPQTPTLDRDAAEATHIAIRIVHHPEPHAVPHVSFPDGSVSTSWDDFHAARRRQPPELYAEVQVA